MKKGARKEELIQRVEAVSSSMLRNGKIYLGELTFTPAAGLIKYNTDEALNRWGKMLKL